MTKGLPVSEAECVPVALHLGACSSETGSLLPS